MGKRILLVRHNTGPEDDRVTSFCRLHGLRADSRRAFAGEPLGGISDDLAGVVIYGGPYNAYDTRAHPFLNDEYRLMQEAIDAGVPLLGICQGAQMIAHMHGAFAGAPDTGVREFGYYEVVPTDEGRTFLPRPLHFCQWHFHTFDIPGDAVRLASSENFENQAFSIGSRIMALQFHAENTIEGFRRWQNQAESEMSLPGAQSRAEQTELMYRHDAAQAEWFYGFLRKFLLPQDS